MGNSSLEAWQCGKESFSVRANGGDCSFCPHHRGCTYELFCFFERQKLFVSGRVEHTDTCQATHARATSINWRIKPLSKSQVLLSSVRHSRVSV